MLTHVEEGRVLGSQPHRLFPRATRSIALLLLSQRVWISVCHTTALSLNGYKPILKLFGQSGSLIIPVFLTPAPIPNFKGNPVSGGGGKIHGACGKCLQISAEIAVYLGNGTI